MQFCLAKTQRIAIAKSAVDIRASWSCHSKPGSLHIEHVIKWRVVLIHVNGSAGGLFEPLGAADMIDVRMRDDNQFHAQIVLREDEENPIDFVSCTGACPPEESRESNSRLYGSLGQESKRARE